MAFITFYEMFTRLCSFCTTGIFIILQQEIIISGQRSFNWDENALTGFV